MNKLAWAAFAAALLVPALVVPAPAHAADGRVTCFEKKKITEVNPGYTDAAIDFLDAHGEPYIKQRGATVYFEADGGSGGYFLDRSHQTDLIGQGLLNVLLVAERGGYLVSGYDHSHHVLWDIACQDVDQLIIHR